MEAGDTMWKGALVAMCLFAETVSAQVVTPPTPPRLEAGEAPALPALAVGGGQVFVEVWVSAAGEVTRLDTLRTTPRYTEAVDNAVRRWRFRPATAPARRGEGQSETPQPVASRVLVAGQFRAPTLNTPTLGEPPRDIVPPSAEVPFPAATVEPPYPVQAQESGVVLIEALVGVSGQVTEATIIRSAPPFDAAALAAARQWRFRPSRRAGRAATYAYLIFGFPQPVVGR